MQEKIDRINSFHNSMKTDFDEYDDKVDSSREKNDMRCKRSKRKFRMDSSREKNDMLLSENHFTAQSFDNNLPDNFNSFVEKENLNISYHNSFKPSLSFMTDSKVNSVIGFKKNISFGNSINIRESENEYTRQNPSLTEIKHDTLISSDSISLHIGNSESISEYHNRISKSKHSYSYSEGEEKTSESDITFSHAGSAIVNKNSYETFFHKIKHSAYGVHFSFNLGLINYKVRRNRLSLYTVNINFNNYLASSRITNLFITVIAKNLYGEQFTNMLYGNFNFLSFLESKVYGESTCMLKNEVAVTYKENSRIAVKNKLLDFSRDAVAKKNDLVLV
jgi:hypothetical protein